MEAFIDSSGFANIEPDHKVYISLTTYGLTKYGYLTGKLIKVSVDTVFWEETKSHLYSLDAELLSNFYGQDGKKGSTITGMVAQVAIIKSKGSGLEYFWQPVVKIKDGAFKE